MTHAIRPFVTALLVALVALFALLPVAGAAPRAAETVNVNIRDFAFDPAELTINVGDTVVWTNNDTAPHTATASDGSFDSGRLDNGQQFSFTFNSPGTFQYVCTFHDTMQATIVVMEAGAAAPAAQPEAPAAQPAPTGSVDAADQAVTNRTVTVANVTSSVDGWIVIHLDEGGQPGRVLGYAGVRAGDNPNVQVTLSEDVAAGTGLWPMLHVDAGAVGTYEFPGADVPVRDADGNVVMRMITVTGGDAAAPAQAPTELPRTAGGELPVALALLAALLALATGALLRSRRA
ncbi:MAG: cupredoxin family copper-binding protein [Chloroflexota bacterium]